MQTTDQVQNADYRPGTKCRLQTKYKMQTTDQVQNADCRPGTKCRLQTKYKMQTADQVQNADCRPGTKCRLQTRYKMQTTDQVQNVYTDQTENGNRASLGWRRFKWKCFKGKKFLAKSTCIEGVLAIWQFCLLSDKQFAEFQGRRNVRFLRLMKCTLMAAFETESCQSIFFIKALLFFVLVCIDSREHERKDELC